MFCKCLGLLSYDVNLYVGKDTLVALDFGFEFAELFDLGNLDVLFVNLKAFLYQSVGNLGCGNGALKFAALANLHSHVNGLGCDLGGLGLSLGDVLGLFMSPLADGFLVLLESRRGADSGEALGNQIIESVTGLYFYHLSGIAEIGNIFLKYDLHNASII